MIPQLSVVIPVYNESGNLLQLFRELQDVLPKITRRFEVIFINDGSTDKSLSIIKTLHRKDNRYKYLSFSRNFGHMCAIDAGLIASKGNRVVIMDADLQDPPSFIPKLVSESKKGYKVVYGVKVKRKEGFARRIAFKSFYRILNGIAPYKMPLDAGTFSLIDRKVVNIMIALPERNKYFSGLRSWAGFGQIGIVYERGSRFKGEPASFRRLFKLAMDGMFSFSYVPLRIASLLGIIFSAVAFLFIGLVVILRIFFSVGLVGWASTMTTILLVSGIQLLTLGVIGEYLARIYEEVKARPKYIIEEKGGIKSIKT